MLGTAYYPMYYYFDWTYMLVIIGAVISLIASARVNSTYKKYAGYRSTAGLTGAQAAEKILRTQGIYDVKVRHISGNLTDNYNPMNKTLNLSDATYGQTSVAAVGVAAHECGHAVQHAKGYFPIKLRGVLVPFANWGARLSWILIIVGLLINSNSSQLILNIGIFAFSLAVLFQIVTLPVEFNASSRALVILEDTGILRSDELKYTKRVLSAAAMTYVASAAASILQLLRLIMLFGGRRRD